MSESKVETQKKLLKDFYKTQTATFIKDGIPSNSLLEADHVQFNEEMISLQTILFNYSIQSILFFLSNKESAHSEYLQKCVEANVQVISVPEKTKIVTFCKEKEASKLNFLKRKLTEDEIKRVSEKEFCLRRRENVLSAPNKSFESLRLNCYQLIFKKQKTGEQKNIATPVIVLSAAPSSLLTLHNVKEFLENNTFVNSNHYTQKPRDVKVTHNGKAFKVIEVTQVTPKDNVVAIFTCGYDWEFKPFKSTPQEVLSKVKGFHLFYGGDTLKPAVKQLNISLLELHPTKRYMDTALVAAFWNSVGR